MELNLSTPSIRQSSATSGKAKLLLILLVGHNDAVIIAAQ